MSELEDFLLGVAQSREKRAHRGSPPPQDAPESPESKADDVFDALGPAPASKLTAAQSNQEPLTVATSESELKLTKLSLSANELARLLRQNSSLRQAFLLGEIFRRPVERWKRS